MKTPYVSISKNKKDTIKWWATSQTHRGLEQASALRRWLSNKGFYPSTEPPVLRVAATQKEAVVWQSQD